MALLTSISGDQVKRAEIGGLCGTYAVEQKCIQLFEKGEEGYLKERDKLEYLGEDEGNIKLTFHI